MILAKEYKVFFQLLQLGLWNKNVSDLSLFPLLDGEWTRVLKIAEEQTVQGLIYCGINKLPLELQPSTALLMKLVICIDGIENGNNTQIKHIIELKKAFSTIGIAPILLKGQSVALYYQQPLQRAFGDIDFYFNKEEFSLINTRLKEKGVKMSKSADGSVVWTYKSSVIEHHNKLIDIDNPFKQNFLKELIEKYRFSELQIGGDTIKVPDKYLNLLLQNSHILKHALGWGIGLRQLCDIAVSYNALSGKIDGEIIKEIYKKAGIGKWSKLLHSFLVEYIGLDADKLPYKGEFVNSEELLELILKGGNFGYNLRDINKHNNAVYRKIRTAKVFFCKLSFAFRYATNESVWVFIKLSAGQ